MPDRVVIAARSGSDMVTELLKAISAGGEPPPTKAEWASLRDLWQGKLGRRRRGHHKSMQRHIQGANRSMLRSSMEFLKIKLRHDPAERELKRTMRANGETYVLNHRAAQCMYERLKKTGREPVPSIKALENILNRSTALEPDREPWW